MILDLKGAGRGTIVLAAALAMLGVQAAEGQRRAPGMRGGPEGSLRGGPANIVERALRLAEEIELSEEQRSALEAIRQELVQERGGEMVRILELGSEVRAGLREPEALREALRSHRDAMADVRARTRDRVDSVLTEDQRGRLQELGRPARAWRDGGRGWRGRAGGPPRLRRMQGRWPGA